MDWFVPAGRPDKRGGLDSISWATYLSIELKRKGGVPVNGGVSALLGMRSWWIKTYIYLCEVRRASGRLAHATCRIYTRCFHFTMIIFIIWLLFLSEAFLGDGGITSTTLYSGKSLPNILPKVMKSCARVRLWDNRYKFRCLYLFYFILRGSAYIYLHTMMHIWWEFNKFCWFFHRLWASLGAHSRDMCDVWLLPVVK